MALKELSSVKCFGGLVKKFSHPSKACNCEMKFSVFLPPVTEDSQKFPVVYWLSGLTCNEDNFVQKAAAQKYAAALGLVLVCPDTSPRGVSIPGDSDSWDFGVGAGFYVNATQEAWREHYNMYDYVTSELPELVSAHIPAIDFTRKSIFGHSMGGHGALICALKNPGMFKSVSAFAPICNPTAAPWGHKAFAGYLGADNNESWKEYDATEIMKSGKAAKFASILIDQGAEDKFLTEKQLLPDNFEAACEAQGQAVQVRHQAGYDHSYFFISTFVEDHLRFHATALTVAAI